MWSFFRAAKFVTRVRSRSVGHANTFGVLSSLEIARKCRQTSPEPANSLVPGPFVALAATSQGNFSPWSFDHMRNARPICLRWFTHEIREDLTLLPRPAGRIRKTKRARTAAQTSPSTTVNPPILAWAWFGFMRVVWLYLLLSRADAGLNIRPFPGFLTGATRTQ